MRILWFEITTPKRYAGDSSGVLAGWQDSLEDVVKLVSDVELVIAFESSNKNDKEKTIDGIKYVPMHYSYSLWDKIKSKVTWNAIAREAVDKSLSVIRSEKPDIIHVFGCEWPFGLVAEHTEVPVVIHIQGAIVPYANALYPPKYNIWNYIKALKFNFPRIISAKLVEINNINRAQMERKIWNSVSNYMGRTCWDKALSSVMHPQRSYYHVDETLRPLFFESSNKWKGKKDGKCILFTTGCTTFWKGPDMMMKTARILKDLGFDFEWLVAGHFPKTLKKVVEHSEKDEFLKNNIKFVGPLQPTDLVKALSESTMYVHTAYVENSPNSICEAQCLGVPVVSTNVGGIATLLDNGESGGLVPANDPWQLAHAIITLASDEQKMMEYSQNGMSLAHERHNIQNIKNQLMSCYEDIIAKK